MQLVPPHYLFRFCFPCAYRQEMPALEDDRLLDLPAHYRLNHLPELGQLKPFADVRIAWNEQGFGFQVQVSGKEQEPQGDSSRPRSSDGAMVWIDTRDTRNIHRASRYCHNFFFLPTGGGDQRDEPAAGQLKINRALQDAPRCEPEQIAFQSIRTKGGYLLEAFLPAAVLQGYDPETNPRLGFYYWIRDAELGDQTMGMGVEFPFWEDPSLWATLELVRD